MIIVFLVCVGAALLWLLERHRRERDRICDESHRRHLETLRKVGER